MLYTREKIDPSDADLLDAAGTSRIRKIGPVILLDTDKPILRCLVGGVLTTLSLDAFDDLVLSKPVIRVVIP